MRNNRVHVAIRRLPLALALASAAAAHADSGVGVDTWRGNALDSDAGAGFVTPDQRGTSWLTSGQQRTPTGNLYLCPKEPPQPEQHGEWLFYGVLDVGAVATSGDDHNALWNRYSDWDDGLILGLLDLNFERPADGSYANIRASRISDDDEYYQAAFGRAGSYEVRAFQRDLPNALSSNARSIWNGVGSNELTLVDGLVAGGSTSAQVAAAAAAAPERELSVNRSKQGLGFSMYLNPQWTAYANLTDEQRKGARPFGGAFFFNYPLPDNGGVLETPRPIDDATINFNGGFRYAGNVWRMDFAYAGSLYRDSNSRYTYATPFALRPVIPGAVAAPPATGQFATEPDNDYHNLKAAFTRKLPMNGEASVTASVGRMSQDDPLIAPIDCQGVFGIGLNDSLEPGPQNPFLYNCADWNTPESLSRKSADLRIDTTLIDGRIVLHPTTDLTVLADLRYNREDYRNTYLAYNPLTGAYGYVAENGAQGSIVPGEIGFWYPGVGASNLTRIRSLPLDMQTIEGTLGVDWRLGTVNTLGATYTFNRYEPSNRERQKVDDNALKMTWVNRALDWLTLRASATYLRQRGDRYDYNPYEFTYSSSLPGFVPPFSGVPAHTVDAMRKYDLASRDESKFDLMATIAPRYDMTISASLRGDYNDYDAVIGRQRYDTLGATLQWEWQPAPDTSASISTGYDRSKLDMANVNDVIANSPNPSLGGPAYPLIGRWWANDQQRNYYIGANLSQRVGRIRIEAGWNTINSRGITSFSYDTPVALAYYEDAAALADNRFPTMNYRVNVLSVGVTIPVTDRVLLRVFDTYERGSISDWHTLGFDSARVYDHRVYTDGGPESYGVNLVGLLVSIRL